VGFLVVASDVAAIAKPNINEMITLGYVSLHPTYIIYLLKTIGFNMDGV
jgi:hypothetical protein